MLNQRRTQLVLTTLLLLLMAALIIPILNNQGLWGDEGWSVRFAGADSPRGVTYRVVEDRHPPLYFLMLYGWRQVAGDTEVALRLLTTFHTLLTGAWLYLSGKKLFNPAAGLFALLIFTLMDQQVAWTEEIRHYPLLMLWTVMSSWALVGWIKTPTPKYQNAYVIALIGGLYTHNFMLIVLLAQGLYALLVLRPFTRLIRLGVLYVLAGIAFAPWLLVFIYQFTVHGGLRHDLPLDWETAETLTTHFIGKPLALMLGLLVLGIFSPVLPSPGWQRQRPRWHDLSLPLLLISVPLVLIVGLTLADDNLRLLTDRNLAIILPALAILIGVGSTAFTGFARGALIVLLLVNGLFSTDVINDKPPWRPIARYIAQHQVADQPVFLDVGGDDAALSYHLAQEVGVPQVSLYELERTPNIEFYAELRFNKVEGVPGLWYIVWGEGYQDALESWGYQRTASAFDTHLGSPIYMYRYDPVTLLETTLETFGGELRLHQVYTHQQEGRAGGVSLWWSATQTPAHNYTVSVLVLRSDGTVAAQHDAYPLTPTQDWQPDHLVYDFHPLTMTLPAGEYQIAVKVYNLVDGRILATAAETEYAVITTLSIE